MFLLVWEDPPQCQMERAYDKDDCVQEGFVQRVLKAQTRPGSRGQSGLISNKLQSLQKPANEMDIPTITTDAYQPYEIVNMIIVLMNFNNWIPSHASIEPTRCNQHGGFTWLS